MRYVGVIRMVQSTDSRIPVSRSTRRTLKAQKRGGETYDELLQKMVRQYDPDDSPDCDE